MLPASDALLERNMEHEMKISSTEVRRLRLARNWSQEHLAAVSGLSLRTIQRVEAEGTASASTRMGLAAAFGVECTELAHNADEATTRMSGRGFVVGALSAGLGVLMCAFVGESARFPGVPATEAMKAMNLLLAVLGGALVVYSGHRLVVDRHAAGVLLALLGIPLVTLLALGLLVAVFRGHAPMWQLSGFGACGVVLMTMALRRFGLGMPKHLRLRAGRS